MKNIVIFTLSVAIICGLFIGVFAAGNTNSGDISTPPTTNPFEYAKAPDGLDAFIYHGYTPDSCLNADTSECVADRLYIYNSADDSLTEISEEIVTAYTCTQTALYYVTADQKIYKVDYAATNYEYLYQSTQGTIENLKSYFDTIYFIEGQTRVMHLDVANRETHEIWSHENLYWAIMLNDSQLIATTTEEDNYLIDLTTNNATWISGIEATSLVTAAVKGTTNNARSTTTNGFNPVLTQENNVSFPLSEYDVDDYNHYSTFETPKTWFHENGTASGACKQYCGSNQCKGFAKYVHDVYAHIEGDTLAASNNDREDADTAWENRTCITRHAPPAEAFPGGVLPNDIDPNLEPKLFDGDEGKIETFFCNLKTGAYVRYGKYHTSIQPNGDDSPENGCHSIVFIARDENGIWVYECNQGYPPPSTCCGVFIEYYTYQNLTKYKFILNYANHNYSNNWGYRDKDYHSKNCSGCAGYVKKEHTNVSATFMGLMHRATFNCCGGNTANSPHTGTITWSYYSKTQHKMSATCCSGYRLEDHTFELDSNNRYVCSCCGYGGGGMIIMGSEQEPEIT